MFLCSYAGFLKGNCRCASADVGVTEMDVDAVSSTSAPAVVAVAVVVAATVADAIAVAEHWFPSVREFSMIIVFYIILKLEKKIILLN
jgi:ABC-type glucose/galactose transport system permease subunit